MRASELIGATVVVKRSDTFGRDSRERARSIAQGSVGLHALRSRNSLRILICRFRAAKPNLPCDHRRGVSFLRPAQLDFELALSPI